MRKRHFIGYIVVVF